MGMFDYVYTYDTGEPVQWQSKSTPKLMNTYHIVDDQLFLERRHYISLTEHLDDGHKRMYDEYRDAVGLLRLDLKTGVEAFSERIPLTVVGAMEVHDWDPDLERSLSRIYVWDYDGTMHMDEYDQRVYTDGGLIINHDLDALQAFQKRVDDWEEEHLEEHVEKFKQELEEAYSNL